MEDLPDEQLVGGDKRDRDRPVQVPVWWLREVNRRVDAWKEKEEAGLHELGAALAAVVARKKPWTHGTVSKCLRAKMVNDLMVRALTILFEMPPHLYHPQSLSEAIALQNAARTGIRKAPAPTDLQARAATPDANDAGDAWRARYDQKMEALKRPTAPVSVGAHQSEGVHTKDAKAWGPKHPGGGRTGSVGSTRKATRRG